MSTKFPEPRKKFKATTGFPSPLPVPIARLTGISSKTGSWSYFHGQFKNGIVTSDPGRAEILWIEGSFGHGNLSSSGYNYKACCNIINESQYSRKNKWKREAEVLTKTTFNPSKRRKMIPNKERKVLVISKDSPSHSHGKQVVDPYPIQEVCVLTLEEALFLSFALGCLILVNDQDREMSIDIMWTSFLKENSGFLTQYAVYHHFRCKGWIIKPGLKFGADWALYPKGLTFYHAQFLVWVQTLWADTLEPDTSQCQRMSDFKDIASLERLSSHVAKTVLICRVLRPRSLTDANALKNISCLRDLSIHESIFTRWEPNSCSNLVEAHHIS